MMALTYSPEFIYSVKDQYELTDELLLVFEGINEMFKTSSQYIDMKKRINLNVKWRLKKKEDISPVNLVLNAMNRLCSTNYNTILEEVMSLTIASVTDIDKLSTYFLQKMMSEEQFIKHYINFIYELLRNGKWVIKNNDHTVTFRQTLLDKLQAQYKEILDENSDNVLFRVFFKILGKMYESRIIGRLLMEHIMDNLRTLYEEKQDECYIEYWILLWLSYQEYQSEYINGIIKTLSKRLQFLLMDTEDKVMDTIDIAKQNIDYSNYILYVDEYNNIDSENESESVAINTINSQTTTVIGLD